MKLLLIILVISSVCVFVLANTSNDKSTQTELNDSLPVVNTSSASIESKNSSDDEMTSVRRSFFRNVFPQTFMPNTLSDLPILNDIQSSDSLIQSKFIPHGNTPFDNNMLTSLNDVYNNLYLERKHPFLDTFQSRSLFGNNVLNRQLPLMQKLRSLAGEHNDIFNENRFRSEQDEHINEYIRQISAMSDFQMKCIEKYQQPCQSSFPLTNMCDLIMSPSGYINDDQRYFNSFYRPESISSINDQRALLEFGLQHCNRFMNKNYLRSVLTGNNFHPEENWLFDITNKIKQNIPWSFNFNPARGIQNRFNSIRHFSDMMNPLENKWGFFNREYEPYNLLSNQLMRSTYNQMSPIGMNYIQQRYSSPQLSTSFWLRNSPRTHYNWRFF